MFFYDLTRGKGSHLAVCDWFGIVDDDLYDGFHRVHAEVASLAHDDIGEVLLFDNGQEFLKCVAGTCGNAWCPLAFQQMPGLPVDCLLLLLHCISGG